MAARLEFYKLAPEGLEKMTALGHYLNTETGLEPVLLDLVYAAGAGGVCVDRGSDEYSGWARAGCGVRAGEGTFQRVGDGEFDVGDYDHQCVEPDCDCAGGLSGSCGRGGEAVKRARSRFPSGMTNKWAVRTNEWVSRTNVVIRTNEWVSRTNKWAGQTWR